LASFAAIPPPPSFAFSGGTIRNIGTGVTANIEHPPDSHRHHRHHRHEWRHQCVSNIIQPTNGTGALTKIGNGTLIFASRGTHSGGTTVNAGTLQIHRRHAGNSALGSGPVVINSGATLETMVNGFGFTDGQSVSFRYGQWRHAPAGHRRRRAPTPICTRPSPSMARP
jgi:autotransporter-associated beta strand protein